MRRLRLIVDAHVVDPALDSAISAALMRRVAAGELGDTLRISRPAASVAFGKRDVVSPGYAEAVAAAEAAGFEPIVRLAGGRAAVFHDGTLHAAHAVRDPDPRTQIGRRFTHAATALAHAFAALGVDARVGDVPGEYCPGAHSVNARNHTKLAGTGQRVIHDGSSVGIVAVVDGADRIVETLTPIYAALGLDWDPATTGSLADEHPGITWEATADAIHATYAETHKIEPAAIDPDTLALARTLIADHRHESESEPPAQPEPSTPPAASAGGAGFDGPVRNAHGPRNPSTGPAATSAGAQP